MTNDIMSQQIGWAYGKGCGSQTGLQLSKLEGFQNEYNALPNRGRVFCCNSFKGMLVK